MAEAAWNGQNAVEKLFWSKYNGSLNLLANAISFPIESTWNTTDYNSQQIRKLVKLFTSEPAKAKDIPVAGLGGL
jgi:hypothetical protein